MLFRSHKRNAPIIGEIAGFGFSSDGVGMFEPSGEGAMRCMRAAFDDSDVYPEDVDYINTHGTSTVIGDVREIGAIKEVFGDKVPPISSTKSLSGHGLGAAGAWELIFGLIMMHGGFLAKSANIEALDPAFSGVPILTGTHVDIDISHFLSNSFGFGGTNASLLVSQYQE